MSSSEDDEPELETLDISNDNYYATAHKATSNDGQASPTSDRDCEFVEIDPASRVHDRDGPLYSLPKSGSRTIRHSLPAYDLWRPFFPTFLSREKFLNIHRPKLRHYNTGPQAMPRSRMASKTFPIKNLTRHIYASHKRLRFKILRAIRSGLSKEEIIDKILLIKKAKDLSAKSGEIFLFEYCEEHPSVLGRVGMASNVKIYSHDERSSNSQTTKHVSPANAGTGQTQHQQYQGETSRDQKELNLGIHEKVQKNSKPLYFFKELQPAMKFTVIENNLYRAPIFQHKFSNCDFLIIRTRNSFYIRPVDTIFTVGQTMPLVAVPPPSENNIAKFRCDLSNVHIHKLFRESNTNPLSLDLHKLTKLFPDYHATVLRRRLTINGALAARKERRDSSIRYFAGNGNYTKLSLADIRRILTPEQYCLGMASLAARERLRELNYTESMIIPTGDVELETEILAAPWNTSRAVLDSLLGKSYLDLKKHLIDPTGSQREGFSCAAWSRSPTEEQQIKAMKSGFKSNPQEPFQYKDKNPMAQKIRSEKLERLNIFKVEAQLINSVQSKVLASAEVITSSEDEDDDEDSRENTLDEEFERQLNDLDKLVVGSRTINELIHEKEEEERRQLLVEMRVNGNAGNLSQSSSCQADQSNTSSQNLINLADVKNKILRITRTYDSPEGQIHRTEIVREPKIIALYVKMKGGSLNSSQVGDKSFDQSMANRSMDGPQERSFTSTKSDGAIYRHRARSRSTSLGPSELCRADGLTLTISKRVFGCM